VPGLFDLSTGALVIHILVVSATILRVIMKRPATGVALAWLLIVAVFPGVGVVLYLMVGERRVGERRARLIERLRVDHREISDAVIDEDLASIDWSRHPPAARGMDSIGRTLVSSRTLRGSEFQLYMDTEQTLAHIARDVDASTQSVLMEFYIWNAGGSAELVVESLIAAAQRGVSCRVLVDAVGGRPWWKGPQPQRLRDAGVQVVEALPVRLLPIFGGRTDLRLHRKIVVVDGKVAWTGSMNLVDPKFFKQDAGVGEWVDAMVRIRGSAVASLAVTMIGDWILETDEPMQDVLRSAGLTEIQTLGTTDIQVIPSGPRTSADGLLQMLLAMVNAAQTELIITTPYFVPDDSLLYAVRGAASRGVRVAIVVPLKVDSIMTRHASRSFYDDMIDLGAEIYLYRDGLLHTKSITVDGAISMFGTVNIDMRSLWLNYEVSLFIYCREFARELRQLQQSYIDESNKLDPVRWKQRPYPRRLLENTMRLMSPLL